MNPQAIELNEIIKKDSSALFELLSKRGKAIFFPKKGLMAQSADAKNKKINATLGKATHEDSSIMHLESINSKVSLDAEAIFPYSGSYGNLELRKLWLAQIKEKNSSIVDATISMPVVSAALTHGLSICGSMFFDDGDTLILPDKYWGNYNLVFANAFGVSLETYPFYCNGGFNSSGLREKLMAPGKTKKVLFNFPNNPTGYSPTNEEVVLIVEAIREAAEVGKKIVVICDDAYFGLVFEEGVSVESIFAPLCNLHENVLAIKIDGATKEDYVWGLRIGFITFGMKGVSKATYEAMEAKTAGVVRGSVSNCSNVSQSLLMEAYKSESYQKEKDEKKAILKSRYDKLKATLATHSEYEKFFSSLPYNSGYFMCVQVKGVAAEDVRQLLLEKYDTGIIAVGDVLRIAFSSLPLDQIPLLFKNVYSACTDLTKS